MKPLFKVNISAIIFNKDKILIEKRSLNEDVFPGLWGIPGGTLELTDINLENALSREIMEEVNINIKNIKFVKNNIRLKDNNGMLYIMCVADYKDGEIQANDGTEKVLWLNIKNINLYNFTPFTKDFILETYERKKSNNSI